jgi:hypothetical protein
MGWWFEFIPIKELPPKLESKLADYMKEKKEEKNCVPLLELLKRNCFV